MIRWLYLIRLTLASGGDSTLLRAITSERYPKLYGSFKLGPARRFADDHFQKIPTKSTQILVFPVVSRDQVGRLNGRTLSSDWRLRRHWIVGLVGSKDAIWRHWGGWKCCTARAPQVRHAVKKRRCPGKIAPDVFLGGIQMAAWDPRSNEVSRLSILRSPVPLIRAWPGGLLCTMALAQRWFFVHHRALGPLSGPENIGPVAGRNPRS